MSEKKDKFIFLFLFLFLIYIVLTGDIHQIVLYIFMTLFLVYSVLSLYVSRKYGAKIIGWPTAIKNRDYTLFLLSIPEVGLIFSVFIVLFNGTYQLAPVFAGFLIMLIGMVFNLIVRTDLGKNWVPLYKTTDGQELVTDGIYAQVRHPFYLSILILFLGVSIISWNIYGLLFFIILLLALILRIKKEENELIAKFGEDYKKYEKETPRIIPKLILRK